MSERSKTQAFSNIRLTGPSGDPVNGDGLLYIGDKPLLVYDTTGWKLNQLAISIANGPNDADPQHDGSTGITDGSGVDAGQGLRQTYTMDSLRKLATSEILTTMQRQSGTPPKQYPNRHEQYTNMGVFGRVMNAQGKRQVLRKGDTIVVVDDSLFGRTEDKDLANYIVGWQELNGDAHAVPFMVYSGDQNSNRLRYKYYNSANRTLFDLECPECEMFSEDGYGTIANPVNLKVSKKSETRNEMNKVNKLVTKPLHVKMNSALPNETNFSFDFTQYEYNQGIHVVVKFNGANVLNENDIMLAKDVNGNLRGISMVNADQTCNMMVYSNKVTEADISLSVVKRTANGPYEVDKIYDLSPESDFVFVNDEYRTFTINVGRANKFLGQGWSWFSNYLSNTVSNVDSTVRTITEILTNNGNNAGVLTAVDQIKTQGHFAKRDENGNWIGTLDLTSATFEPYRAYKIHMTQDKTWLYDAYPLTSNVPLHLSEQWNWIGYPFKGSKPVDQVLSSTILNNANYIKGQRKFSTITGGALDLPFNLERNTGYKLHMTSEVQGEVYNVVDLSPTGTDLPQVPNAKTYTFSKVTNKATGSDLIMTSSDSTLNGSVNNSMSYLFGSSAQWVIRSDTSAMLTLANGKSVVENGNITNWIYTGSNFHTFDVPFVKDVLGYNRKFVGMKVNSVGYVIEGTEVSDVKVELDFQVQFEDESGDSSKNEVVTLSSLGIGPVIFSDANMTNNVSPLFRVDGEKLELKGLNGNVLSIIDPVTVGDEFSDGNIGYEDRGLGNINFEERPLVNTDGSDSNWSIWYPATTDITKDVDGSTVVPDEEDSRLVFTWNNIVQVVTVPIVSSPDTTSVSADAFVLGNLWAIEPKDSGLVFYYRENVNAQYEAQVSFTV